MARKHSMPAFLVGRTLPDAYERWLERKAVAHVRRDLARGRDPCSTTRVLYKESIHAAVVLSGGKDSYTGEQLAWELIGTYDNEDSKAGRHAYKAGFALLPTVDHVDAGGTVARFRICAWRTNDAKNDLSIDAFVDLCRRVVRHAEQRSKREEGSDSDGSIRC